MKPRNGVDRAILEAKKIAMRRAYIPKNLRGKIKIIVTEDCIKIVKLKNKNDI